jgi:primosomal protein N'
MPSTIACPHCKEPVTAEPGEEVRCPACGGALKIHAVGTGEQDEQLKRLLSMVKIVERVDEPKAETPPKPEPAPAPAKKPWWKFWG